jgi:hypothetical protein
VDAALKSDSEEEEEEAPAGQDPAIDGEPEDDGAEGDAPGLVTPATIAAGADK